MGCPKSQAYRRGRASPVWDPGNNRVKEGCTSRQEGPYSMGSGVLWEWEGWVTAGDSLAGVGVCGHRGRELCSAVKSLSALAR